MNPHEKTTSSERDFKTTVAIWISEVTTAAKLWILVLQELGFLRCLRYE